MEMKTVKTEVATHMLVMTGEEKAKLVALLVKARFPDKGMTSEEVEFYEGITGLKYYSITDLLVFHTVLYNELIKDI